MEFFYLFHFTCFCFTCFMSKNRKETPALARDSPSPSTSNINQSVPGPSVSREADLTEISSSSVSAAQSIRQSTDESYDLSHNQDQIESRSSERREGGEGGHSVSARSANSGLDINVSVLCIR